MREHPIPPVTEDLQYRAIGLVRGIYKPETPEVFTRGSLIVDDGEEIETVVLGKVISLMKQHISIQKSHLWVVYPRSRDFSHLHLQISGIWEPSTLDQTFSLKDTSKKKKLKFDQVSEGDNYFSIRGELIYTKPEANEVIIKIRQINKSNPKKSLPFKLRLRGRIPINCLRNFLSLKVIRSSQELNVENYEIIAPINSNIDSKKKRVKV